MDLSSDTERKVEENKNIWVATVRPDGRPHLVPVWFVWVDRKFYLSIDPNSVKSRNILMNPQVVLALEDGSNPVICEGEANFVSPPFPEQVTGGFFEKYGWEILAEKQYNQLVEIVPGKWLVW